MSLIEFSGLWWIDSGVDQLRLGSQSVFRSFTLYFSLVCHFRGDFYSEINRTTLTLHMYQTGRITVILELLLPGGCCHILSSHTSYPETRYMYMYFLCIDFLFVGCSQLHWLSLDNRCEFFFCLHSPEFGVSYLQ